MKKTAVAPTNIAFIKYWGRKNEELRLPENGSVSMCLSDMTTTTTVEFSESFAEDSVTINGAGAASEASRVVKHLDRIRALAGITHKASVVSENSFPTATGLSSSASGFAALSLAASSAAGLDLSEKELSILARQGSGSACRSIPSGFVEWLDGSTSETSYAVSLYPPDHWDVIDIVAVVSDDRKDISTSEGQTRFNTSPFRAARVAGMNSKIVECKKALETKDFTKLGEITEAEALNMHAVMITSEPPLIYWTPGTLTIMKLVQKWRREGLEVYFTMNTGQDIHILSESKNKEVLQKKLSDLNIIKNTIVNSPTSGARLV